MTSPAAPPRPPSRPVELHPVGRADRAVLTNLGQLFRHDLSEFYQHVPNHDGTFNDRAVDLFLAGADPESRGWLITAASRTAGFVLTSGDPGGGRTISAFFVVRGLRRTGVGRIAALQAIRMVPGRWRIGFQRYNPGVEQFWSTVATELVGDLWEIHDAPAPATRPPDTFITFDLVRAPWPGNRS
ncbi:GNAT family N-acetyltransferase [Actinoplanes xinjiangensis]|uniref:GNAT family N-acetyltransferase n=1 Tax=Actinoplanes xinjiangensis TaxID=512350 RepID=UPI000D6BF529|nr:GNAT family N-acetyltransferase [Actinoplanes xinjiangensis]